MADIWNEPLDANLRQYENEQRDASERRAAALPALKAQARATLAAAAPSKDDEGPEQERTSAYLLTLLRGVKLPARESRTRREDKDHAWRETVHELIPLAERVDAEVVALRAALSSERASEPATAESAPAAIGTVVRVGPHTYKRTRHWGWCQRLDDGSFRAVGAHNWLETIAALNAEIERLRRERASENSETDNEFLLRGRVLAGEFWERLPDSRAALDSWFRELAAVLAARPPERADARDAARLDAPEKEKYVERSWALSAILAHIDDSEVVGIASRLTPEDRVRLTSAVLGYAPDIAARDAALARAAAEPSDQETPT